MIIFITFVVVMTSQCVQMSKLIKLYTLTIYSFGGVFLVYKLYLNQSHHKTKRKISLCKKEQNMACWNELMVDQGWRGKRWGKG